MSKLTILIVGVFFFFFLSGCESKNNYEEDKKGFIDFIIQLDDRIEYNKGSIYLQVGEDIISYDFIMGEDNIYVNEQTNNIVTSYHFSSNGHYSYFTFYDDTNDNIFTSEVIDCTRNEFATQFIDFSSVKLNIDMNEVTQYSRTEHLGVPGDPAQWDNVLSFNSDYIYNTMILDTELSLTNVVMYFSTSPVKDNNYNISTITITGYFNGDFIVIESNRN